MTERILGALPLGTNTPWGIVEGVHWKGGERYYWLVNRQRVVSYMPALEVEADYEQEIRDVNPSIAAQERIQQAAENHDD